MYRSNLVFFAACLGMLLFGVVFLSLGSVNNLLAERFQLDDVAIGTLTALLPLGILLGSLAFGPVVDRFGYRWMLAGAALAVGAGLEGLAFTTSKLVVQLCVLVIGVGGGVLNGATNALAADVSEGQRAARLSLLGVFFGIGALAMPSTLALLSRYYSLPTIVASIGAAVLIPAAYCLAIDFPPPKQRADDASLLDGLRLLRDPVFLFAGLALAVQSGMEGLSNDWMTRYLKKVTFAGRLHAEWQLQLGLIATAGAMTLARLALAGILRRVDCRAVLAASLGLTAVGAALFRSTPEYGTALLAALLVGAGLAAVFPIVLSYIGDLYPDRSGTAFSAIFVIALTGNMAVNKAFGYVAHAHGVEQYATMMLSCLAVSAVLLTIVVQRLNLRTSSPGP
ncbi:MAG: MFS transporter [Planctomycetota bacterium]|nr:MAG: MFS transporter [Planctomycetota bacterium]